MIRAAIVLACVAALTACAAAPAPREDGARDRQDSSKPAAVFSHIEIGGGN